MTSKTVERKRHDHIKGTVRKCLFFDECNRIEIYDGIRWKEKNWHYYKDGVICANHYQKLRYPTIDKTTFKKYREKYREQIIINNAKFNKIHHPRRISFKDKSILLKHKPRSGYCSRCHNNIFDGSCKQTQIHHVKYHEDNLLKDTIELCSSCHAYETWKKRKEKKKS